MTALIAMNIIQLRIRIITEDNMKVGEVSPQWAQDLMFKWVELDDKFFGLIHNVLIFYTDYFANDVPARQVRIFAETEDDARLDAMGKRDIGLFATYIDLDGFKLIETPVGLEQWTLDFIKNNK